MVDVFRLSDSQLAEIARAFRDQVGSGLAADGRQIRCLPTWCATELSQTPEPTLVLDLGGTNLRAAKMERTDAGWRVAGDLAQARLPVTRGTPLSRSDFLAIQADLLARVAEGARDLPLGYCFSYPAESLPSGDARLIRWTKEVFVPDTEGRCVGEPLLEALHDRSIPCSSVTVVNDTVASLLAGAPAAPGESLIGLIVGTGTNMAALMPAALIPKLGRETLPFLPVNLESGNFHPPFLTRWDDELDRASEQPGTQRFEKAVSGAYLGRLLKSACPAASIDPEAGSQAVVAVATGTVPAPADISDAARSLLLRSARLVAATLAGLASLLPASAACCRIVAEGSLFWKAPNYHADVKSALDSTLAALGRPELQCRIVTIPDANLAGAALGAQPRPATR